MCVCSAGEGARLIWWAVRFLYCRANYFLVFGETISGHTCTHTLFVNTHSLSPHAFCFSVHTHTHTHTLSPSIHAHAHTLSTCFLFLSVHTHTPGREKYASSVKPTPGGSVVYRAERGEELSFLQSSLTNPNRVCSFGNGRKEARRGWRREGKIVPVKESCAASMGVDGSVLVGMCAHAWLVMASSTDLEVVEGSETGA